MSLIVEKNQTNKLSVTVTEKTTLDNPFYIMNLFSKDRISNKIVRFTGDTSTNTVRINQFNLTECPLISEDLFNASIYLEVGTYDYIIYETLSSGLTISGGSPVESGLLTVTGPITTNPVFNNGSGNTIVTFK